MVERSSPEEGQREFIIDPYLSVRLEGRQTVIYIAGKRFTVCKRLMLDIPQAAMWDSASAASIDEAADRFRRDYKQFNQPVSSTDIPPDVEFWGHCSNLQAWADGGYDSRLLHRNLAFPLLKALSDAGAPHAREALGREVAARLASNYPPVVRYLVEEKYLQFIRPEDVGPLSDICQLIWHGTHVSGVIVDGELDLSARWMKDAAVLKVGGLVRHEIWQNIQVMHTLKVLNLSFNWLTEVPNWIYNLQTLRYLNLGGNRIQTLSNSIEFIKLLEVLDLNTNDLRSLPDEIGSLVTLHTLNLHANGLEELPETIGNLQSLKELQLLSNNLSFLPSSIGDLHSLQLISLNYNRLMLLPKTFGNLNCLQRVFLGQNRLEHLPGTFCNLQSLQSLDLDHNKFSTFPEPLTNLRSLHSLSLSSNQIVSIPETIGCMRSLRVLRLDCNQLTTLPEAIGKLPLLKVLQLNGNPFEKFPGNVKQALAELEKRGCHITW